MTLYCFYNKRTRRCAGVPVRNIESTSELASKIKDFGLEEQFGIMTVTVGKKRGEVFVRTDPADIPPPSDDRIDKQVEKLRNSKK